MAEYAELIKSLRQCSYGDCIGCKNEKMQNGCRSNLLVEAAAAIKELQNQKHGERADDGGLFTCPVCGGEMFQNIVPQTPLT